MRVHYHIYMKIPNQALLQDMQDGVKLHACRRDISEEPTFGTGQIMIVENQLERGSGLS